MESKRNDRLKRQRAVLAAMVLISLCALVVLFEVPPQNGFYPRCPFFTLTGYLCPGCGGTRALHAFLHGQIITALRLNPLVSVLFAPVLAVTAFECYWIWLTGRVCRISLPPATRSVAALLVAAFWIFRNVIPS